MRYSAVIAIALSSIACSWSGTALAENSTNLAHISEVVFSEITNLTCEAIDGNPKPIFPSMNGDTPGTILNLYGFFRNTTKKVMTLRVEDGLIQIGKNRSGQNDDVPSPPLAGLRRPRNDEFILLGLNESVELRLAMPASSINSAGYGLGELELPVPNLEKIILIGEENILLNFTIFDGNTRIEKQEIFNNVKVFVESPERTTWSVDGEPIDINSPICKDPRG